MNVFLVLITLGLITFAFLTIFFSILTKDAFIVEKWALKNLTKVCYFIVIILGILFIKHNIKIDQFLTYTGATIVFWYWYKKYERDKEFEFTEKYNSGEITIESFDEDLSKLSYAFYLHEKWYLPDYVWKMIDIRMDKMIVEFFHKNLKGKSTQEVSKSNKISETLSRVKFEWLFFDYFNSKIDSLIYSLENSQLTQSDIKETSELSKKIVHLYKLINDKSNNTL